jgi:hypothetical protein
MEIVRQISTKAKAFNVIGSCVTGAHFDAAKRYIDLYHQKFDDFLGYNELKRELQRVRVESLTPRR